MVERPLRHMRVVTFDTHNDDLAAETPVEQVCPDLMCWTPSMLHALRHKLYHGIILVTIPPSHVLLSEQFDGSAIVEKHVGKVFVCPIGSFRDDSRFAA